MDTDSTLEGFGSVDELVDHLTTPSPALVADMARLGGDLMILGAGGKMGPTLALLARRALDEIGGATRVFAVSRFSDAAAAEELAAAGVEVIRADLLAPNALDELPYAANIIYMVGHKFGATGSEGLLWTINVLLPGLAARRFAGARMVAFSSGNVYPFTPVPAGGATEDDPTGPVGEYAQSVLGRERVLSYVGAQNGVRLVLFRLNYAVEMRYGVLLDIGQKVAHREAVPLAMGHANVIWQGDANTYALRSLLHASDPPLILNATGPETLSVRRVAERFGRLLGVEPVFEGEESPTALLSNAQRAHALFGYPAVSVDQVIGWTAAWLRAGGETLDKPTKFQVRTGKF